MKSFGKLFVRLFLVASLIFFATIVSLFGAGAVFDGSGSGSGSDQALAPVPAPSPHP